MLGCGVGFAVGIRLMAQEVANYEVLVKIKDGELDGYRKGIDDRLKRVEDQLSAKQLSAIEPNLKAKPYSIDIISDGLGVYPKKLQGQWLDVFKSNGWDAKIANPTAAESTKGGLIFRTSESGATAIEKALNEAGVKFELFNSTGVKGDFTKDFVLPAPFIKG